MGLDKLKGLTVSKILILDNDDEVIFYTTCNKKFRMYHSQDCCESVNIDDIAGDIVDLLDSPILISEEISCDEPAGGTYEPESFTWTFYKFATANGYVTFKWYGVSNGYYSESASFEEVV